MKSVKEHTPDGTGDPRNIIRIMSRSWLVRLQCILKQACKKGLDEFRKKCLLIGEVEVKGSLRDASFLHNIGNTGGMIPFLGKDGRCSL